MAKKELKYIMHNPNTPEATAKAFLDMMIQSHLPMVQDLIRSELLPSKELCTEERGAS